MHYCLQPSKDEIVNMHALSSCAFIKVSSMSNFFGGIFPNFTDFSRDLLSDLDHNLLTSPSPFKGLIC